MGPEVKEALDALDKIAGEGFRPSDIGAVYLRARVHLDRLVEGLRSEGGEMARVARILDGLMAGADSIVGTPSHLTDDPAATSATPG